jgi:hypothetical protein
LYGLLRRIPMPYIYACLKIHFPFSLSYFCDI